MTTAGKQCVFSALARQLIEISLILLAGSTTMFAQWGGPTPPFPGNSWFFPGNLVVSRSVYVDPKNITAGTTVLPPNCSAANCPTPVTAIAGSAYPYVWNNNTIDGSFGVTSKILLDHMTTSGKLIYSMEVPNSLQKGVPPTKDQMVTSFSSKSELALNLSTDGNFLTFMGYDAPIGTIDASNSNTPGVFDSTNPVAENSYRVVAQVDAFGRISYTLTNAYSGNNGRAAVLNNSRGANLIYTSGNAGNGGNPQPNGIIIGAGAQIMNPQVKAEVGQAPGPPTPLGSFSITELGDAADKVGKDTNFRGLRIFNNVVYLTKGSGGNGVNTVYFIDTTGKACPSTSATPGVGLPQASANLPSSGISYDPTLLQTEGVVPYNMCILKGFPTALKSTTAFPFGIWFANATTLYVADEGDGYAGGTDLYTHAAGQTTAGLQKWVFNSAAQQWELAYTLQAGLGLGTAYTVPNYFSLTDLNLATCVVPKGAANPNNCSTSKTLPAQYSAPNGLPWAPATDGLRNLTGMVNRDGTVTIYAITSTVSGNGDQGADPNELVAITDKLSSTTAAQVSTEKFTVLRTADYGEVLRGVSFAPGTEFAEFPGNPDDKDGHD